MKSPKKGFTAEERAAMRERAQELKAATSNAEAERDVAAKIAAMSEPDRTIAGRIHEIVAANAPELWPRTWYGMPAYASEGKIVCFYQAAEKFNTRYASFGFNDTAMLDDGSLWPVAFAIKELTPEVEAKIGQLVKKAVS